MDDDGIDLEDLASTSYGYEIAEDPSAQGLIAELDRKAAARKLALPTNDLEIRRRLRAHGQPISLFGERREDRRERLRSVIMAQREAQGLDGEMESEDESGDSEDDEDEEKEEEFYTEGDEALEQARRWLTSYSMPRTKQRIARQRQEAALPLARILDARKGVFTELKTYTSLGSQFADERPISSVRFSPNSEFLATGSWSGTAKIWSIPQCRQLEELKGHNGERIGQVAWHPFATLSQSRESLNLATSGADSNIQLWNLSGLDADPATKKTTKPISTLTGHSHRVCKISFHPSGRFLASASYDGTWRLWDVERSTELLLQEGHSKELYSIAMQPHDGALIASGGLDAIGRVWDLRSGKSIMVLDGHIRDILSLDWSEANAYQIASGSNDDTVKIWDLRMLKNLYSIPAHRSTVSEVKFSKASDALTHFPRTVKQPAAASVKTEANGAAPQTNGMSIKKEEEDDDAMDVKPDLSAAAMAVDEPLSQASGWATRRPADTPVPLSGMYLASAGYDGYVKLWSADDWQLVKSLNSEAGGKVMSVDLSQNGKFLATGEWSRTFKLFSSPDVEL